MKRSVTRVGVAGYCGLSRVPLSRIRITLLKSRDALHLPEHSGYPSGFHGPGAFGIFEALGARAALPRLRFNGKWDIGRPCESFPLRRALSGKLVPTYRRIPERETKTRVYTYKCVGVKIP